MNNSPRNILELIPPRLPVELLESFVEAAGVRIERIVSWGHATPEDEWLDQPLDEWVLLLEGAAKLRFEDRVFELTRGDHVRIAAHQKHRVDWTAPDAPTIWLAVHFAAS